MAENLKSYGIGPFLVNVETRTITLNAGVYRFSRSFSFIYSDDTDLDGVTFDVLADRDTDTAVPKGAASHNKAA